VVQSFIGPHKMKMIFRNAEPMSYGVRNHMSESDQFCHYSTIFTETDEILRSDIFDRIGKSRSWQTGGYYSEDEF